MRILALVPEAHSTHLCLDAAAAAAKSLPGSEIVALHVRVDPLELLTSEEEVAIQRLRDAREGTARERAAGTRTHVEEWKRSAPLKLSRRITYEEAVGSEEQEVLRASHEAELLVMVRPTNLDGHDAFHAAVFLSHKSLLLVPHDWKSDADAGLERHVLIAWDGSDQAVRAVDGAMPILRNAPEVTILTVRKPGPQIDPSHLLDDLAREGVNVRSVEAEPIEGRTSARILATAEELGASLIVMGAYRYGSLLEWALGATTQRALAQSKTPLMLAH